MAGSSINSKGRWRVLSLLGMVPVTMVLMETSVNVSLSAMVRDLDTTISAIQAVLSLYALATAVFMLPGAKLADRFGAKRIFRLGVLLYGVGAAVAAVAQNSFMLFLGMSLVQGLAASLMVPTTLALIGAAYPGEARVAAMAAYSAIVSVAMAVGPLLTGFITTYFTWRIVFGLGAVLVALLLLRSPLLSGVEAPKADPAARFDPIGTLLAMAALACIIVGALLAKTYGLVRALRPFTLGPLTLQNLSVAALLLLLGFAFLAGLAGWLVHAKKRGRAALVDIALFKSKTFNGVLVVKLCLQLAMVGILFALPVYLQNVLGYTALATGFAMLPLPLALFATALVAVRVAKKTGRRAVITGGALCAAAGAVVLVFVFAGGNAVTGGQLVVPIALLGVGMGCMMSLTTSLALASVGPKLANQGSGTVATVNNLASSLGTAVAGSLLLAGVRAQINTMLLQQYPAAFGGYTRTQLSQMLAAAVDKAKAAAPAAGQFGAGQLDAAQLHQLSATLTHALNTSMAGLMLFMACIAAAAALAALLLLPGRKQQAGNRL